MTKARMETFSDGVIAIIITIMVLELRVTHDSSPAALIPLVPVFLSYVLSFVFLGIYWEQPSSAASRRPTCERWSALGQSAPLVLAIVNPLCYCLDGREPFRSLDACLLWRRSALFRDRLLHPCTHSPLPTRARFPSGHCDGERLQREDLNRHLSRRNSAGVCEVVVGVFAVHPDSDHVAGSRSPH